jgi:hypothetical protein
VKACKRKTNDILSLHLQFIQPNSPTSTTENAISNLYHYPDLP